MPRLFPKSMERCGCCWPWNCAYPALNASTWVTGRARRAMCALHGSWKLSSRLITQSFTHFYFYLFWFCFCFAPSHKAPFPVLSRNVPRFPFPTALYVSEQTGRALPTCPRQRPRTVPIPRTERRTRAPFPGAAPRGVPHLRALRGCCGERAAASSCAHRVTIDGRNRPSRPTGSGPGRGAGAAAVAGVVRERVPLAELRVTDCCGSGGHFKKTLRRPQRAVPPPQLGCVPPVPAGTPGRGCAHSGGEMRLHRARRYL